MPLAAPWNSETARIAAQRSAEARRHKRDTLLAQSPEIRANPALDPVAISLVGAMKDSIEQLKVCRDAKERAALAKSVRDLREAYHMVTGFPKPGQMKVSARSQRQSGYGQGGMASIMVAMPAPQQPGPLPDPGSPGPTPSDTPSA